MPREKRATMPHLRGSRSGPGESSAAGSSRQPPPPRALDRKIIKPRVVNFASLASMFPTLSEMIDAQGWILFMTLHTRYYPHLVQQFYANIYCQDERYYTTVKGKKIALRPQLFASALTLPCEGAEIDTHPVSLKRLYQILTERSPRGVAYGVIKYNANEFPPTQRLIHHMMTTILYPKAGSRELVTVVHKFLFLYLFTREQINLPSLILDLVLSCHREKNRSLPYAAALTSVFTMADVDLRGEAHVDISSHDIYNRAKVESFMRFRSVGGTVIRQHEMPPAEEAEEEAEDGSSEENEDQAENVPQADTEQQGGDQGGDGLPHEPPPAPQYQNPTGVEARLDSLDTQYTYLSGSMDTFYQEFNDFRLSQDAQMAQMNQSLSTMSGQLESLSTISNQLQTQNDLYSEIRNYLRPPPPDDSNM